MKLFTPDDFKKYFYASLFLAIICLILAVIAIGESGQADIYIKTHITGNGSGSSYHEGRLGESSGFRDAKTDYSYEKSQDEETGATTQNKVFYLSGGDGSYWNYDRVWTSKDIAGANQVKISVGKIQGSYYGSSGMNISYNEADGTEEFESSLTIEAANATISLRVIQWNSTKPVSLEEIDRAGKFVVDQLVKLSEPIKTEKGWLDFCELLDRDAILSDENGIYVFPDGYTVNAEKKLVRLNATGGA
jgi:hypothetical protein